MVEGRIKVPMERMTARTMNQISPGLDYLNLPGDIRESYVSPSWEEKTGEKTGFIFKRDEVIEMKIHGYRCRICNYIEIYAI
jgi:hypothetical protein